MKINYTYIQKTSNCSIVSSLYSIVNHYEKMEARQKENEKGSKDGKAKCDKRSCRLKPYNIEGKTVITNAVDSTGVLLSVMIRQTVSGLEGQCHLSGSCSTGSCSTAGEVVALLGQQLGKIGKTLEEGSSA